MSHVPHGLAEEFPEDGARIHALEASNAHFARLVETYRDVNRAVHRAETDVEPTNDAHLEELKKRRLQIKDELASMLRAPA